MKFATFVVLKHHNPALANLSMKANWIDGMVYVFRNPCVVYLLWVKLCTIDSLYLNIHFTWDSKHFGSFATAALAADGAVALDVEGSVAFVTAAASDSGAAAACGAAAS